jgi:hypothetical protein
VRHSEGNRTGAGISMARGLGGGVLGHTQTVCVGLGMVDGLKDLAGAGQVWIPREGWMRRRPREKDGQMVREMENASGLLKMVEADKM